MDKRKEYLSPTVVMSDYDAGFVCTSQDKSDYIIDDGGLIYD